MGSIADWSAPGAMLALVVIGIVALSLSDIFDAFLFSRGKKRKIKPRASPEIAEERGFRNRRLKPRAGRG